MEQSDFCHGGQETVRGRGLQKMAPEGIATLWPAFSDWAPPPEVFITFQ